MGQKLEIQMIDPSGNRTVLVKTPLMKAERDHVSSCLMNLSYLRAEQVAFEAKPLHGSDGRLEMMRNRFSGNAARAYGYMICRDRNLQKCHLEMSGINGLFEVRADRSKGTAEIDMPVPDHLRSGNLGFESFPLIPGRNKVILLAENMDVDETLIHDAVEKWGDSFAIMEILFLKDDHMTPVVCGSSSGRRIFPSATAEGCLATQWYLTLDKGNGRFSRTFVMPGGDEIHATIRREEGKTIGTIGGRVFVYEPQIVEIPSHGDLHKNRNSV